MTKTKSILNHVLSNTNSLMLITMPLNNNNQKISKHVSCATSPKSQQTISYVRIGKTGRNLWDTSFDSKNWWFRHLLTPSIHPKILWSWIISEAYYDTFICGATIPLNETIKTSWLCTKRIKTLIVLDISSSHNSFASSPRSLLSKAVDDSMLYTNKKDHEK